MAEKNIRPSQLRIGLHVRLDLPWMQHSFMSNSFKIKNERQLAELKRLGLKQIAYDPGRSDVEPLPLEQNKTETAPEPPPEPSARDQKMWQEKQARIKKMKDRRICLNRCEKEYTKTIGSVRKVMRNIMSQPRAAVEEADEMITGMVENLMVDQDTTMHLVHMKGKSESTYFHSVNVTILSLMMGKRLGLNEKQMHELGLGALFHDMGHSETPDQLLRKTEPRSKAEEYIYSAHTTVGARMAEKIGTLPPESIKIIAQHHEMMDGSGYPKGLKGNQISDLAQIVAIVNAYDNLCNKLDPKRSCTPYEAVSLLFAKQKQKFDEDKLARFISSMGVYPPGTVVKLSNDAIAAVMSINPDDLLSPRVMVYDPQIPKTEALIIDLQEEGLKVAESMRISSLSEDIRDYLNLGDHINVFIDTDPSGRKQ